TAAEVSQNHATRLELIGRRFGRFGSSPGRCKIDKPWADRVKSGASVSSKVRRLQSNVVKTSSQHRPLASTNRLDHPNRPRWGEMTVVAFFDIHAAFSAASGSMMRKPKVSARREASSRQPAV